MSFTSILSLTDKIFEAGEALAKEEGLDRLESTLGDIGFVSGEAKTFAEDHPVEAAAAFVGAAILVTALSPALAAGAEILAATEAMEAVGGVITDGLYATGLFSYGEAASLGATAADVASTVAVNEAAIGYFDKGFEGIESSFDELFSTLGGTSTVDNVQDDSIEIDSTNISQGDNYIIWDNNKNNVLHMYLNNANNKTTLNISHSDSANDESIQLANLQDDNWTSVTTTSTSDQVNYKGGGTEETTVHGDGSYTKDDENANGTSEIAVFSPDGSSADMKYSGPNGTGIVDGQDKENADGSSTINTVYDGNNSDYYSVTVNYSGKHGTGKSGDAKILLGHDVDILDGRGGVIVEPDGYYKHYIVIDSKLDLAPLEISLSPVRDDASVRKSYINVSSVSFTSSTYENDNVVYQNYIQFDGTGNVKLYPSEVKVSGKINANEASGKIEIDTLLYDGNFNFYQGIGISMPNGDSAFVPIHVTGNVYNSAIANITTLDGKRVVHLHVGDPEQISLLVNNANSAVEGDSLRLGAITDPFVKKAGPLDVQAGKTQVLTLTIDTSSTDDEIDAGGNLGVHLNYLNFVSHNSELTDVPAKEYGVYGNVEISVNDYANPGFSVYYNNFSRGVAKVDETHSVFDFGNVTQGTDENSATFKLHNFVISQFTDNMSGSLSIVGSGFLGNLELNSDDVIDASVVETLGSLKPDTGVLGKHEETIVFHPTDFNSSGYSGTLPDQYLTIRDNVISASPPSITVIASADAAVVNATGPQGGVETFTATAHDSVFGNLPVKFKEVLSGSGTAVVHSGDTFSLGRHTIIAFAVDPGGASATSAPFSFTVADDSPPVVQASPDKTVVEATSGSGAVETFSASVTDAVDGSADPIIFTEQLGGGATRIVHSGDVFAVGIHTIVASATDAAGNMGQASPFTFTVAFNQIQGVAEDGYLSGATIFADANGNMILDAGEASTITDSAGNFTLTGGTGTLIAVGGTDITTGLPFGGILEAPAGSTVISPLTTLVAEMAAASVSDSVRTADTALGLPTIFDLTHADAVALAAGGNATGKAAVLAQAVVADTAALLAAGLTAAGATDGGATYTRVIAALASALAAGQPVTFADAATISAIGQAAGLDPATAASIGAIAANANAALTGSQNSVPEVEARTQGRIGVGSQSG